jgi:hypothetical protein
MLKAQHIPLKLYMVIIASIIFNNTSRLFLQDDNANTYLHIMRLFDPRFVYFFWFVAIRATLSILHIIPLFCYIYRRPLFTQKFWQRAFILKIIFDIYGYPYETLHLKALLQSDPALFLYLAVSIIALYLPFYAICFGYAFKDLGIFPEGKKT